MRINQYSEVILDQQDIVQGLYSGKLTSLSQINTDDSALVNQFNQNVDINADPIDRLKLYVEPTCSIEEFDSINQSQWMMPDSYKTMDIELWLIEQCTTEEEMQRVAVELGLFSQHRMMPVLNYLKYLVDFMREHKIVWGLGRGSSVASYCLYLIGIHKVDSIKYQLDINEFLKGE